MKFEKYNLKNKFALITGAAGLLGSEHAEALLESGATVIMTDLNSSALESAVNNIMKKNYKTKIIMKTMDVTKPDNIIEVKDQLYDKEGIQIDILINNAAIDPKVEKNGVNEQYSRFENFKLDEWNMQIAVGLTGAYLCSKTFGFEMSKNGRGGVILNIASDLSVISPDQRLYRKEGIMDELQPVKPVTYSVIKAGLIGLTRYLSTYWADKGVRCNALSPGGIYNNQEENFVIKLNSLIPLGRMAKKNEYRSAIQFLCSEASSYMNGQNLVIDGGRSIL
jgi:NAD(P)-dependent dehydrogenase (short-subunit alcohol dehydrogenase family)